VPAPAAAAATVAAAAAARPGVAAEMKMARVEIDGPAQSDMAARREQSSAKQIIGHDELVKFGDTTLSEALKRLPGITVGGAPGRGGDIRMRGLGNGYTLILLNGEAPARGFPLDSISPDMIDRVEIMPAATAEFSAQGIAGTINLVLKVKRGPSQGQNEAKAGATVERGRFQPTVSAQYGNAFSAGTYTLSAFANRYDQHNDSAATIVDTDAAGAPLQAERRGTTVAREGTVAGFNPRISVKLGGGDTLAILPLLFHRDGTERTATSSSYSAPAASLPAASLQTGSSRADSLRTTATWMHHLAGAGKLELKAGFNLNQSVVDSRLSQFDGAGAVALARRDRDDIDDKGWSAGVKWLAPMLGEHGVALGAEAEDTRRDQTSFSRYSALPGVAPGAADTGADIDAGIRRYALFAQDEWKASAQLSVNAGLRWETLRVNATAPGRDAVDSDNSVFSPSLHMAWKLSPQRKDQVRASVSRSYKSPLIGDLTPWTALSVRNAPTLPDVAGNARLAPEVALGFDVAYERYVGQNGVVSVSAFSRDIHDLIRREVGLRQGRWVSTPVNLGGARSTGVTLEAKLRLSDLAPGWPGVDLRANYSRYWSSVDAVPGPDNRLAEQPEQVVNAGFDYGLKALPLTVGANASWIPSYRVQTGVPENRSYGVKRGFDAYGVWRFNPAMSLRLSVGNLSHSDYVTGVRVDTGGGQQSRLNVADTATSVAALLSLRF
jgi:iron complex outermembrane receptor protein